MFVIVTADGKSRAVGKEHGRGAPQYLRNVPAELYEPIDAVVTVDTTLYTADNATWPTADGGLLEGATDFVEAAVVAVADAIEPAEAIDVLDAAVVAVGEALLAEPAEAVDVLDAEVISAAVPIYGGARRPLPRPELVVGVGYGILPALEGVAVGVVGIVGRGAAALPRLGGTATGHVGVVGRSAGQLVIRGVAIGERGAVATADAILKGLSVAGDGAAGVRGSGSGMIVKLEAAGRGRHDDDEAAVLTFLLAA